LLVSGCASLPKNVEREPSIALANTEDTRLGKVVSRSVAANPGRSGIHPLPNAREAFAARILLARAADRSLDLQYYVWQNDTTGQLLFDAVWQAAERGVRVRMLLDDANTKGLDPTIAALAAHPNIQVRLFNPLVNRGFRLGNFITEFARVNRRMHNKSFTADSQAVIVGGRNVGDVYYGADTDVGFRDLDALAIGPIVRDVSREFDLYWNSESAYPSAVVIPAVARDDAIRLRDTWQNVWQQPNALRYAGAVRDTPLVRGLLNGELEFEWTTAELVHDDPSKVLQPMERTDLHLLPHLEQALGKPMRELDLVSPYFVPGRRHGRPPGAWRAHVKVRCVAMARRM
jgi:putative cardiolipin synthase